MLTCHLQLKVKRKTECPFLMYTLFVKIKHLPLFETFINTCFKTYMVNIQVAKETTLTVEKQPLILVLPYLGSIPLQPSTKQKKSLKNILNCCKLQIVLINKTIVGKSFHFKDQTPLLLVLFINFSVDSTISHIMVNV